MTQSTAIDHLGKDPVLKPFLSGYQISLPLVSVDPFRDLAEAILNQQLSNKAAATIFQRFLQLFPEQKITPDILLTLSDDTLRASGISRQKIGYLRSLASTVSSGDLDLNNFNHLSDEEVITALTKVKGIGRWTAEMFLMFSLGRPDVFSLGDLGLCTAVSRLYGVEREDKAAINRIAANWSPYRSFASLYLWRILHDTESSAAK